ncbi:3700_t:CDS:2 [Scutellospora calospora]|uniref:3700_t:CDS:1 n=1 Tax=Scutellospora calospora TaxID=85575 RepID=A0ACA9JVG0_9GLOM|nr:3700_t:CDS:2 [Scutellospora calospora]
MDKSSRYSVLADDTLAIIIERNKCREENIDYPHENTIDKNMNKLKNGIKELEQELSTIEESGTMSSKELKEREDVLIRLTNQVEKLETLVQDRQDISARELLLGLNSTQGPSSRQKTKTVRFSDQIIEAEYMENSEVLQLQQRIIHEQDRDLDRLNDAIGRQRELGILIGDELTYQVELLEDTEGMVDQTERTLDKAKRSLSKVSKGVKDNGCYCVIFSLILVLIIIIVLAK